MFTHTNLLPLGHSSTFNCPNTRGVRGDSAGRQVWRVSRAPGCEYVSAKRGQTYSVFIKHFLKFVCVYVFISQILFYSFWLSGVRFKSTTTCFVFWHRSLWSIRQCSSGALPVKWSGRSSSHKSWSNDLNIKEMCFSSSLLTLLA